MTFTHDPRANNSGATERHSSAGSLVGGVIGGVVAITITITCTLLYRRHRQKRTASRFVSNYDFTGSNTELNLVVPEQGT